MARKIVVKKRYSDEEAAAMAGTFLTEDSYDEIVRKEDVDVYREDGRPLLRFRTNILTPVKVSAAYDSLNRNHIFGGDGNRGVAGGGSEPRQRSDGRVSKTRIQATDAKSGIVGYFDRYTRIPYCRQTAFNMHHFELFKQAYPLIKEVDDHYRDLMPGFYRLQREKADKTSQDFVIKDTAFTTVTVNKNWQTAVHQDAGDFPEGFGNLTVMRAGKYTGGHTVFPQYRIAVDVGNCDTLMMDVHEWHGNTPIVPKRLNYVRLSLVMYYRNNMINCGSADEELERAKNRQRGDSLYG